MVDLEGDAIDGGDAAEALSQVGDLQGRGHTCVLSIPSVAADAPRRRAIILDARWIRPSTPEGQNAISTITAAA